MSELTETDVGMSEYLSNTQGIHGILKLRFQDFLVNEINKSGRIVRLTNFAEKPEKEEKTEKIENIEIPDYIVSIISAEDQENLKSLNPEETYILKVENDKGARTKIHEAIRKFFPKLESETIVGENEERNIKVSVSKPGNNKRRWVNKEKSRYNKFVLYKENIATMDAINLIAKKLHLNHRNCFQYAGNKDKRGVTVQEMTTTLSLERIFPINQVPKISIGSFTETTSPLQLGELNGNYFSIVLRNIVGDQEQIKAGLKLFEEHGFINYFGMQRFGTASVPTYEIGKSLIASNWEKAIDNILSKCLNDAEPELKKYIKNWKEEGNALKAYKLLERKSTFEGYLLNGISRFGNTQLTQALSRIPRNTRMLYLHSYQSFVWNRMVSKRIKELGNSPVVGDLVFGHNSNNDHENSDETEPDIKKAKLNKEIAKEDGSRIAVSVKQLTENDVNLYKMTDIVMPLPGYDVILPNNAKDWYQQCFVEDGVDSTSFQHNVKEYALPGAYRKVIGHPCNVEWEIIKYDDYKNPLILSDRDILRGIKLNINPDGNFTALNVKFGLPSSSYATVALRELSKSDMSSFKQSILGNQHELESKALMNMKVTAESQTL